MRDRLVQYVIENQPKLLKYAMRINGYNMQKAQEVLQDIIVIFLEKDFTDTPVENVPGYVKVTIKNRTSNIRRSTRREVLGQSEPNDFSRVAGEFDLASAHEDYTLFNMAMEYARENLSPGRLRALEETLRLDGIFVSIDGLSPETVKVARRRAIMQIRQHFEIMENAL